MCIRDRGQAIRLEVEAGMDKRLLRIIKDELSIEEEDIYHCLLYTSRCV